METQIYTSLEGSPGAIRLLQVLPGAYTDEIDCRLHEATLGPSLSYTALSYVWENHVYDKLGSFTPTARGEQVAIRCDGRQMKIGSNLHSALRRLRDNNESVHLWVDKLCIDQDDLAERNHQVALMRNIYEGSREVVIWLGDYIQDGSLHEDSSAFAMIAQLAEGKHFIKGGVFSSDLLGSEHTARRAAGIRELERMMAVSWWRRIWVVQETVVSFKTTVRYGDTSLPWTTFAQAAANFASEMNSHPIDSFGVPDINMLRDPLANFSRTVLQIEKTRNEWMSGQPATLLALLRKFRSRQSSDKRDKVFALLGLVTSWQRVTPLVPDYALSIEEVLWRSTVKIIASTQSLSVLEGTLLDRTGERLSGGMSRSAHQITSWKQSLKTEWMNQFGKLNLEQGVSTSKPSVNTPQPTPSWVVDWTTPPMPMEVERLSHLDLFNASADSTGLVQLHGISILEVQGFVSDEIATTGDTMPDSGFGRMRATIDKWLQVAFDRGDFMVARENFSQGNIVTGARLEAFARSICGGLIYDITDQPRTTPSSGPYRRADNNDLRTFRDWSHPDRYSSRRATIIDGTLQAWTDVELNQKTNSIQFAIETASAGRSFFVGKRGCMGVGPPGVQVGDRVCIILGSRVPLILRPGAKEVRCREEKLRVLIRSVAQSKNVKECSDRHERLYKVVGDAYVDGMMDGEIFKAAQKRRETPSPLYLV